MPIQFTCPHCGSSSEVADEYAGQTGPCVQCGKMITIMAASGPSAYPPPARRSSTATVLIVLVVVGGVFVVCGGILAALLIPAIGSAREAARRAACTNNLKQIAIAMHNYLDANGSFPPAYTVDENGQPLHSWRVLLLPYLEQSGLYQQIDLDQPWDSPQNQFLTQARIPLYSCPSALPTDPQETSYVMIVGPGTISDGPSQIDVSQMMDGFSSTIMIVEIAGSGIHWAEPRDLEADKIDFRLDGPPGSGISSDHARVVNVVFCDGHVDSLSKDIDPELVRAMTTIAGEELVYPGDMEY